MDLLTIVTTLLLLKVSSAVGRKAGTYQFPYHVAIERIRGPIYFGMCSGACIHKKLAIVSSRCEFNTKDYQVAFGHINYSMGRMASGIEHVFRPQNHTDNDIVIVRTLFEMYMDRYAKLPEPSNIICDTQYKTVVVWDYKPSPYEIYRSYRAYESYYYPAETMSKEYCRKPWWDEASLSLICVMDDDASRNAQPGRILIQNHDDKAVLVGVAGTGGKIFTNVSSRVDWIKSIVHDVNVEEVF